MRNLVPCLTECKTETEMFVYLMYVKERLFLHPVKSYYSKPHLAN